MGSVQESGLKCPICGKNRLLSDYYQFTVGPKESDTRAEYLLPVQAMNDTGLLRLIEHPEILADNWGESA